MGGHEIVTGKEKLAEKKLLRKEIVNEEEKLAEKLVWNVSVYF